LSCRHCPVTHRSSASCGVRTPLHHGLPGARQNLQDHYISRISYAVQGVATVNERSRGVALAAEVLRYLVTGRGMLTYSASLAAASIKVLEEPAAPDAQCSIALGSFEDGQIGAPGRPALRAVPGVDDFPGINAGAWQMRPASHGYVEARSPNPAEAPAINPHIRPIRPIGGR
jgi:choline dehydrogenase